MGFLPADGRRAEEKAACLPQAHPERSHSEHSSRCSRHIWHRNRRLWHRNRRRNPGRFAHLSQPEFPRSRARGKGCVLVLNKECNPGEAGLRGTRAEAGSGEPRCQGADCSISKARLHRGAVTGRSRQSGPGKKGAWIPQIPALTLRGFTPQGGASALLGLGTRRISQQGRGSPPTQGPRGRREGCSRATRPGAGELGPPEGSCSP